jgi:hypothetical protein
VGVEAVYESVQGPGQMVDVCAAFVNDIFGVVGVGAWPEELADTRICFVNLEWDGRLSTIQVFTPDHHGTAGGQAWAGQDVVIKREGSHFTHLVPKRTGAGIDGIDGFLAFAVNLGLHIDEVPVCVTAGLRVYPDGLPAGASRYPGYWEAAIASSAAAPESPGKRKDPPD